jgi:hypothetical protein
MAQDTDLTVFYDNGRRPVFERDLSRREAELRVADLFRAGFVAIIVEDHA